MNVMSTVLYDLKKNESSFLLSSIENAYSILTTKWVILYVYIMYLLDNKALSNINSEGCATVFFF